MKLLTRYWITFERLAKPTPLNLGCGVTAFGCEDALEIVRDRAFAGRVMPKIIEIQEDVDVSKLDPKHVVPNIGSVTIRGIWFPMGL
jgi:hypothetical protein